MKRRNVAALAALVGGAYAAQTVRDRRAIHRDPAYALLSDPPRGAAVEVTAGDGTPLHAEIFGRDDAPTVVLVHGWTCALRFWAYQLRDLAADHRVVAYDLRGHGRSGRPADPDYRIETFADDLGAVLDACVPAGERAVVAGHSLGAMTIAAYAGRHPEEVSRRIAAAALLNTGLGDLISESMVLRTPARFSSATQVIGRAALSASAPLPPAGFPLGHRAVKYIALSPGASPATVDFCERMVLECPRDARAGSGGTLTRIALLDALAHLTVPTLVVAGAQDRLTPPVHSERMVAALPQVAEHVVLDGVGHMGPLEAPGEVTRRLRGLAWEHLGVPAGASSA